jgi:hypothetical protein
MQEQLDMQARFLEFLWRRYNKPSTANDISTKRIDHYRSLLEHTSAEEQLETLHQWVGHALELRSQVIRRNPETPQSDYDLLRTKYTEEEMKMTAILSLLHEAFSIGEIIARFVEAVPQVQ